MIFTGGFAMTKCTTSTISFSSCKSRKVQADFSGGEITSDGGVLAAQKSRSEDKSHSTHCSTDERPQTPEKV